MFRARHPQGGGYSYRCLSFRAKSRNLGFFCVPGNLRSRDVSTSLDMTVLGLETSCDETGVAILRRHNADLASDLLASEVASQIAAHEKYGGIVPEIASRNHLIYAPRLVDRAANSANTDLS